MLLSETLAPAPADNADFVPVEPPADIESAAAAALAFVPTIEIARQAYNVADNAHLDAMHGRNGQRKASAKKLEALKEAELAAADLWHAQRDHFDKLARRILEVPATDWQHALAKAEKYIEVCKAPWAAEGSRGGEYETAAIATEAMAALFRDLRALSATTPPPGAFAAALAAYKAANKEWRDLLRPVEMGEKPIKGDVYERTQQRSIEARDALYSTRTSVGAEIATKLALYYADYEQEFHETLEGDAPTLAITDGCGASDDMRKALANIYLDLKQLAPPPAVDRAEWDRTRAAYDAAYAAHPAQQAAA